MNDLAQFVRETRLLIANLPPGPARAAEQRRFETFIERLEAMPHKVAVRAEMLPADQVRQILVEETAFVCAALDDLG